MFFQWFILQFYQCAVRDGFRKSGHILDGMHALTCTVHGILNLPITITVVELCNSISPNINSTVSKINRFAHYFEVVLFTHLL